MSVEGGDWGGLFPRRAARERGGPLPSIVVADALLDERREVAECATTSCSRAGLMSGAFGDPLAGTRL
jgi:hypothetical protein